MTTYSQLKTQQIQVQNLLLKTDFRAHAEAQLSAVLAGANRSCAASWNGFWIENPRVWFSMFSQIPSNCKNSTWSTNNGCVSSPIPSSPVCPRHRGSNYRLGPATGRALCRGKGTVDCVYMCVWGRQVTGCMGNWKRCMHTSVWARQRTLGIETQIKSCINYCKLRKKQLVLNSYS